MAVSEYENAWETIVVNKPFEKKLHIALGAIDSAIDDIDMKDYWHAKDILRSAIIEIANELNKGENNGIK
ncbi:hypothetical protein BG262_02755 [Floricoccus penangensis]|uniref:Uncharacterized protein n=1 Tax=Floricoccus penangensis TaxID=1859475 RepID=A0A9Q5JG70_9LACT|nr:hypothetical protein [Floricoccus penangensis]OFI46736.1 hypothetical protein BG262_02755 [Floricoccus penangensis]